MGLRVWRDGFKWSLVPVRELPEMPLTVVAGWTAAKVVANDAMAFDLDPAGSLGYGILTSILCFARMLAGHVA